MTRIIKHEGNLELLPEEIRALVPKWKEAAILAITFHGGTQRTYV